MKNEHCEIHIGARLIGEDHLPLVIAEVGINHEGDVNKALAMVDAAVAAGAECIKFQCHITEEEMIPTDIKPEGISRDRLWDIIKRCELTEAEERRVQAYCTEKGILFLSTPFSRAAVDRLSAMNVPAFKIGSGECNNYPFLKHVARKGRPVILSTGMNNLDSIHRAISIFVDFKCPIMLMHCSSIYPTPYSKVRLGAVPQLKNEFNVPIGLSDHSLGIYTCLAAVALGACVLEKHFTLTREWPGPDVPISIEPEELADLVKGSRAVWEARGGVKKILPEEQPVINFAYASVVTVRSIRAGEAFTVDNIWVKRPGSGPILASGYDRVLGKTAKRDLVANTPISPDDIERY